MADFDFLFLVKTPGMYYEASNAELRISSQARSHAAMAFHRRRHRAMQTKRLEPKGGLAGRLLMPKPSVESDREEKKGNSQEAVPSCDFIPQQVRRQLAPLNPPIDVLPGVPYRDLCGFSAAAEFYSTVKPDQVHAPVFHIFDVSNTFGKSYYDLMTHEVALHAGVAVVNMVRDVFRPDFHKTGPSVQVLRLIQVAISKLRQHMMAMAEDSGSRQIAVNDDGAITAALFLGHMASGFGDLEAFRMHRNGIKTMIESRGGLDALGLDGMLKCSVLQFESWWTHIYRDTSVFASSKPSYNPVYLVPPFCAETSSLLSNLPSGFQCLAKQGKIAVDIINVLSNIAAYEEAIRANPGGVVRQMEFVASLPPRKGHADFCDACTCLLVPGPNFEKYLVFALICYASVAFSPNRHYLSASHTAFRTPRLLLTQELPDFRVAEEEEEEKGKGKEESPLRDEENDQTVALTVDEADKREEDMTGTESLECLIWMWLVLIDSWRATGGGGHTDSEDVRVLERAFRDRFPDYCDWNRLEGVLERFFCTAALKVEMKQSWMASSVPLGVESAEKKTKKLERESGREIERERA